MPNTSILDEQLKRGRNSDIGWPWQFFTFSLAALGLSIFVYFGMEFGYIPYLNSQIKDYDAQIKTFDKSVSEDQKQALILFYSQLVNAETLLNSHKLSSLFFDNIERNTHANVYFNDFNLSIVDKNVRISGVASNFDTLSEQLDIFKKMDVVDRVVLENAQNKGTNVTFSAIMDLNEKAFQVQQ